jgi:hypothetical protein
MLVGCALFVIAGLSWWSVGECAGWGETVLLRVAWTEESQLNLMEEQGGTLRYCQPEWAVVELPVEVLENLRLDESQFSVIDTVRAGARYWLARVSDASARDSVALYGKLYPLDERELFLLRVDETLEPRVARWVFSMMLLPKRTGCSGLRPRAAPSVLETAARGAPGFDEERLGIVSSVAGRVSLDSIMATVHFLTVDDSTGGLRTRYTFRDETLQMAQLLRDRLREAMGGNGEDSLHVFLFRYGGIDYYFYNVVGRLPGRVPGSGTFVLCGHYDSTGRRTIYADPDRTWDWRIDPAPGADDNGSGVASVLECARVLCDLEFDFDIEFVLFCAEEQGLFGSLAYAEEHAALNSNILGVLNFDMHAFRESPETTFVRTNTSSEWLSNHVERISEQLRDSVGLSVGLTPVEELFDASDHSSFWISGYDAVHFFEHSSLDIPNPYYHTIHDTEEKLNYELSCRVAKLAAASMAYFSTTSDPWDFEVLQGDLQFAVEGGSSDASRGLVGQTIAITPSFHNVGGRAPDTLSVRVSIYDGDPSAGGWLIGQRLMSGAIPPGGSVPLAAFYWLLQEEDVGVHSIYLVVDSANGEESVANNVISRTFGVHSHSLRIVESFVFPNPSEHGTETTSLRFSLTRDAGGLRVDVYDVSGERVGGCRDADCGGTSFPPRLGANDVSLAAVMGDGIVAPGVYFFRLQIEGEGERAESFGKFALVR